MKKLIFLLVLIATGCAKHEKAIVPTQPQQKPRLKDGIQPHLKDSISHFECLQTELSKEFDFRTRISSYWQERNFPDSHHVQLFILQKESGIAVDTLALSSGYYYTKVLLDCDHVRSYSTGKNKNAIVQDYDFGDLIIADLNFDHKEDIALIRDSGGNGGPAYAFYLQNRHKKFMRDAYLSDDFRSFPFEINARNRTIVKQIHANVLGEARTTIQWRPKSKRWVELESIFVPCCPELDTLQK